MPPGFAPDGFLYSVKTFPLLDAGDCWRGANEKTSVVQTAVANGGGHGNAGLCGVQQTLPAVPPSPETALGYNALDGSADSSDKNIAQETDTVNYPAGYLLGGIVRVCFDPLLRFQFSVSAPACTDTSLRSPPPPDSENRCAFRLGVFGRAVTSAGLLKRECPGSDIPSRSNNSRVFRWD